MDLLSQVISSAKAREEEFQLAFNRAREQTEAREAFFADLKIQFEEAREIFERDTTLASASMVRGCIVFDTQMNAEEQMLSLPRTWAQISHSSVFHEDQLFAVGNVGSVTLFFVGSRSCRRKRH